MRVRALSASIAVSLCLCAAPVAAESAHSFKGNVEVQYRTNTNIKIAPFPGSGFDFADPSEFESGDEEDGSEGDDEEEDDGDDFAMDDDFDLGFDEDELENSDNTDEDGDGIDDILDPDDGGGKESLSRYSFKVGFNHRYKINEDSAWVNGVKLVSDHNNNRSNLDKINTAISTGWEYAPKGSAHKFKTALSYVNLEKDNKKFVDTLVVTLGYQFQVSKAIALSAAYNYQDKDITNPTAPDSRIDTLSLGADFKLSKNDIVKIKYAPKVEDSTKTTRNTDAYGYDITYTRKLPWDMTLGLAYGFDSVKYTNLTPKRKDDNDTYAIELNKSIGKTISLGLGYETRDRSSNIPGKDAKNSSSYLQFAWKF